MPTQATLTVPAFSHQAEVPVRLASNVNPETISNIIRGIGVHYGCLTCGLGGVGVTLSSNQTEAPAFSKHE